MVGSCVLWPKQSVALHLYFIKAVELENPVEARLAVECHSFHTANLKLYKGVIGKLRRLKGPMRTWRTEQGRIMKDRASTSLPYYCCLPTVAHGLYSSGVCMWSWLKHRFYCVKYTDVLIGVGCRPGAQNRRGECSQVIKRHKCCSLLSQGFTTHSEKERDPVRGILLAYSFKRGQAKVKLITFH